MPHRPRIAVLACTLVCLAASVLAPAAAEPEPPFPPRPMFWDQPLADPSVVVAGDQWYAVGTGLRGRTMTSASEFGGWVAGPTLLSTVPVWASNANVWAPDVERAPDGSWLAYYAVPAPGLPTATDRCIGVATSPGPGTPFTPVGSAPLVCPGAAATPPAGDALTGEGALSGRGVIDPASYIASDGRRFLLYRTQGMPSSIRIVRLRDSGLSVKGASWELVRDAGVLENPVLVDRGGWRYLLMSRGDFGGCGYRTVWRRSTQLQRGWDTAEEHVLASRATTGVCGPAGADYVPESAGRANRLFLHGWVCDGTNGPCPTTYSAHSDVTGRGRRVLYVARLRWRADGPQLGPFAQGPEWTLPPPPPLPDPAV